MTEKPLGERLVQLETTSRGLVDDMADMFKWRENTSKDITILNQKVGVGQQAFDRGLNILQAVGIGVLIYFITRG